MKARKISVCVQYRGFGGDGVVSCIFNMCSVEMQGCKAVGNKGWLWFTMFANHASCWVLGKFSRIREPDWFFGHFMQNWVNKVMQRLEVESQGHWAKSHISLFLNSSESVGESFWRAGFLLSQISKIFVISLCSRGVSMRWIRLFL